MLKFCPGHLLLLALISTLLGSCQTEYHTQFNKDFSGSQSVTIDLSDMVGFLGEMSEEDDADDLISDDTLRMIADTLSAAFSGTGAENFYVKSESEETLVIGFDFAGLETFDNISSVLEKEGLSSGNPLEGNEVFSLFGGSFERNGKWLTIPLGQSGIVKELAEAMSEDGTSDEEEGEGEEEDGMEAMMGDMVGGMMGGSMRIEHKYTFAGKIKKVKGDIPYRQDGKTLFVEYSINDLVEWQQEGKNLVLQVKAK